MPKVYYYLLKVYYVIIIFKCQNIYLNQCEGLKKIQLQNSLEEEP